jgi:hypothetical protein
MRGVIRGASRRRGVKVDGVTKRRLADLKRRLDAARVTEDPLKIELAEAALNAELDNLQTEVKA